MKVGLLICSYNRPEYLKQCLWSLERADLSHIDLVVISDDCSSDSETLQLILNTKLKANIVQNTKNLGIKQSLLKNYEDFFALGYDLVINLDADAIVRPDFANKLIDNYFCGILTGFHCTTKNANGTERHKILHEEARLYVKQSVGGINLCINKEAYEKHVKPALETERGNFDHMACISAGYAYCLKESVVQHIGFDSSMGHIEQPDVADDFYFWDLPQVTLLGVDNNPHRLNAAKRICTKWIKFGHIVTLTPDIRTKEQYSEFIIKQSYKHVKTSHMLIFQHDGYVHNWQAWNNDWLRYDYIGAPWWYSDGMDVGNGGFSLRSRRLMEILATDKYIQAVGLYHPEDDIICRKHRRYLESQYGIKFAPLELAERFSYEGYMQPTKKLSNQFGVHGKRNTNKGVRNEHYVVNQFQGLGDVLFLVPLIRALMQEGNTVIWPIADHYFDIAKHFPDIDMRRKSEVDIPYECRLKIDTKYGKLLPYRFAQELMGKSLKQCMAAKYLLYGHDWKMWRALSYKRDRVAEGNLVELLKLPKKFQLVNVFFGEAERGAKVTPLPNPKLPIVEMRTIEGYSLIDWLGVIELAKEIHVANSSVMYLLELMQLNKPVYVYKRKTWGEVNFEHTAELWGNKDFKFEE